MGFEFHCILLCSVQSALVTGAPSVILLAYSRLGGLEGEALRSMIFLLLLFASFAGKKQQQKNNSRGPAAPAAPAGELASSITYTRWESERRTTGDGQRPHCRLSSFIVHRSSFIVHRSSV